MDPTGKKISKNSLTVSIFGGQRQGGDDKVLECPHKSQERAVGNQARSLRGKILDGRCHWVKGFGALIRTLRHPFSRELERVHPLQKDPGLGETEKSAENKF